MISSGVRPSGSALTLITVRAATLTVTVPGLGEFSRTWNGMFTVPELPSLTQPSLTVMTVWPEPTSRTQL